MANINDIAWFQSLEVASGGMFPLHRQQVSRTAGGTSLVRDLGDQLWIAEFTTVVMRFELAYELETDLLDLGGSLDWVLLADARRPNPKNWNGLSSLDNYSMSSVDSADRHIVNLVSGTTALSKGDYFSFFSGASLWLHRITERRSATSFKVWPAISLAVPVGSIGITVNWPRARFQIDPEIVNSPVLGIDDATKLATISFRGIQA